MHKFIAVAALCVACFAVPVLPSQAAPMSKAQSNCLIFPMFKKECWDMGAETAMAVPAMAMAATTATVDAAADAASDVKLPVMDMKLPMLMDCSTAPAGSGHLLDC